MAGGEQTWAGRFFDRHPLLLRALALIALAWGAGYLTWRVGWSGEGANPVLFAMLLATEVYGLYALAILAWFSWSRPPAQRPEATPGRKVDVYVCTYDEPAEVVMATLAGCRALTYPHTTYLLDDGRRAEMRELAKLAGAEYLTRPDNSHAKAGNLNAALPRTDGDLVFVLDADHVPMPDSLDALVGYFDDERMAIVQTPHDFFNHDSVQHYVVGRHEQSLFYRVICPGKDRHGAAYWCGSAALISRPALLEIGGVATETIAEDFHTTIRLQRYGWRTRYHDEVLVQGLAPHDLDGYLLQRDRWARGNLAVFRLPESPLRAKTLNPIQRLSFLASLLAYLAPPMRLLLLLTLGLVLWTGELPMKISVAALAALWAPYLLFNLSAGAALARGYMRVPESAHYELLTMEIYTRALRCALIPGKTAFEVTPKQGRDGGGLQAVRKLHLVLFCTVLLGVGTLMRLLDLAGVGPLPDLPGIAAVVVPLLGLFELRRLLATTFAVGRRRQRRLVYRFEGDAPAHLYSAEAYTAARLVDASAAGLGMVAGGPVEIGSRPAVLLTLTDAAGAEHEIAAKVEVRTCRESDGRFLIGATILEIDPEARLALMEWCYVVCSHERLRGHRPAAPLPESEAIVVSLDDYRDPEPIPAQSPLSALGPA
ncbi:MAG TPA: glycosyltransferase [Solirubrobacterales bacterium]|jgi:cellulose synthase (UDP-forming)|nr:glycosyltransferase [Solirubrobacterales bacterium]